MGSSDKDRPSYYEVPEKKSLVAKIAEVTSIGATLMRAVEELNRIARSTLFTVVWSVIGCVTSE